MCPLWPVHYVFMYLAVLGPVWLLSFRLVGAAGDIATNSRNWNVNYAPEKSKPVVVDEWKTFEMNISQWNLDEGDKVWIEFIVDNQNIAEIEDPYPINLTNSNVEENITFNVTGKFLGYAKVCPKVTYLAAKENPTNSTEVAHPKCLKISVIRKKRLIDKIFTMSVIALVTIIYINMGAALDMRIVKETLKRPIGPLIGFMSQFIIMPVLAYGFAKWLIPRPSLQLGLFITGCSPGGGASNIWTLMLGGNLDLSITMTAISTFSAFAMMPLWILTLGATIFHEAQLKIPYSTIGTFAVSLIVPLFIGLMIQRFLPKFAKLLVKILKPFAIFLIVFIVVFAIFTNLYLFQTLTWEITAAGLLLPWSGYILGGGTAWLLKQDWRDVVAIAIETGVQNTGLAILALQLIMDPKEGPEADLCTALPVAVAMMTPVLPTILLVYQKIRGRKLVHEEEETKDATFGTRDPLFQSVEDQHNGNGYIPRI